MESIPVIDLFAGPGGLNEGFSEYADAGHRLFKPVASFEKDEHAHATLTLRAALRIAKHDSGDDMFPAQYYDFLEGNLSRDELIASPALSSAMKAAEEEVFSLTLGNETRDASDDIIRRALAAARRSDGAWVLIGGPPCQAYSIAGRSRMKGSAGFATDARHTLYKEYLHIITEFRPTVFVMENVKGMLSSQHDGGPIFESILRDLRGPSDSTGYDVYSLATPGAAELTPADFIIKSELYGIPQRRHRVILLGVRRDARLRPPRQLVPSPKLSVEDAIGDLPQIRSQVRPRSRDGEWDAIRREALALAQHISPDGRLPDLGSPFVRTPKSRPAKGRFREWVADPSLSGVTLHESRGHMPADLRRYAYLAARARMEKRSLKLADLPPALLPNHRNAAAANMPFPDRFRVQLGHAPSSTVVSHISKDGHYYIHPDPFQMRSLTVREAARLQTFPDNYFFVGSRTQQYHQVGNAVPPLLANQLAEIVSELLAP